jgi:hypothetical protein
MSVVTLQSPATPQIKTFVMARLILEQAVRAVDLVDREQ